MNLLGMKNYAQLKEIHRKWIDSSAQVEYNQRESSGLRVLLLVVSPLYKT
jgi:hypothetical protein